MKMKDYEKLVRDSNWQVPKCDVLEYLPKENNYCVCIPVLNEGERIRTELKKIKSLDIKADFIIADGASNDGALDAKLLKECGIRAMLIKRGPGRMSAQLRTGWAYALLQGYDGIIIMDGNNKDEPSDVNKFIQQLESGMDHVQGSRFLPGGKEENTPLRRKLAIKLIHRPLINFTTGFKFTDTTNGFRGYSRKFLSDERVAPLRDIFDAYELHYYLAVRAVKLGFNVTEVPVTRVYPKDGSVPTKISNFYGNFNLLMSLLKACFGHYNPR